MGDHPEVAVDHELDHFFEHHAPARGDARLVVARGLRRVRHQHVHGRAEALDLHADAPRHGVFVDHARELAHERRDRVALVCHEPRGQGHRPLGPLGVGPYATPRLGARANVVGEVLDQGARLRQALANLVERAGQGVPRFGAAAAREEPGEVDPGAPALGREVGQRHGHRRHGRGLGHGREVELDRGHGRTRGDKLSRGDVLDRVKETRAT